MPFLVPAINKSKSPRFYIVRGIAPHLGVTFIVQKMALSFLKQNKKVLIFDSLLGLKNIPSSNKNSAKISLVLNGKAPLSDLIIHDKGLDVISGRANQNLTAISPLQQQQIKESLKQLAKNYDIVLIDMPFQSLDSTWADLGENLWVVSADKEIICNTLTATKNQPPQLVLNLRENQANLNQIYAFIKILCPDCQITNF